MRGDSQCSLRRGMQFVNYTELEQDFGGEPEALAANFALNTLQEVPQHYKV